MNTQCFFYINLILTIKLIQFSNTMELIQIHTITRHGQRSPCYSYPTDPYKNFWKKDLCQLTEKGIEQLEEVGLYLRQKYRDIIPINFHKKKVYVRSSDTDRTIISSIASMRTLFAGQIIPVHTVPKRYDYLLKMSSKCPYHSKMLIDEFRSEKYNFLNAEFENLFRELEHGTSLNNVDLYLALRICDSITVWNQVNLSFPNWLSLSSISKCENLLHWKFIISYSNYTLTRFRGGPLVKHIIENMSKKAQNFKTKSSGMKMINFFTHDSTMAAFLSHINCFNRLQPPVASTIIIELYYSPIIDILNNDLFSNFSVRFLYRNDTKQPAHFLILPMCKNSHDETLCRLDILIKNFESNFLINLAEECGINDLMDYWIASSKSRQDYFNREISKDKQDDDKLYLLVYILIPLIITEIIVLFIFYKLFKR